MCTSFHRKNLEELDIVHKKLQQKLSTSDIHDRKSTELSRAKSSDPKSRINHWPADNDSGDLRSETSSVTSERTPPISNANHPRNISDLQQSVPSGGERTLDSRELPGRKSSLSDVSEDWEDSVQFSGDDIKHHDNEHHQRMMHQYRDDDAASDVIVPKALNDVSSANFGNGAGVDFIPTFPDVPSKNIQNQDQMVVRLQEETSISHVDRTYNVERTGIEGIGDDEAYKSNLPDKSSNQNSEKSTYQSKTNNQGQVRHESDSEDSIGSVDENRHALQDQGHCRTTHSSSLPLNTVESDRDRTRILADATNYQYPHDVRGEYQQSFGNSRTSELNEMQNVLAEDPGQIHGNEVSTAKEGEALLYESLDPKTDIASRHLSQASGVDHEVPKNIWKLTSDVDSIPRSGQPETSHQFKDECRSGGGNELLQRQRSLSLSSEDSVILTLDPDVAKRQQRLAEEKSADSVKYPLCDR